MTLLRYSLVLTRVTQLDPSAVTRYGMDAVKAECMKEVEFAELHGSIITDIDDLAESVLSMLGSPYVVPPR